MSLDPKATGDVLQRTSVSHVWDSIKTIWSHITGRKVKSIMGVVDESQYKFTGIQRYFNSVTTRGRFNWVIATYGTCIAAYLFFSSGKKSDKQEKK